MSIDRQQVAKIALLSRLHLSDVELNEATEQMKKIVDLFDQLQAVNTDNIEPLVHAIELQNIMCEDKVQASLDRKLALSNAPDADDECFRVVPVL